MDSTRAQPRWQTLDHSELQGVCTQAASIQCRLDISAEASSSGLEGSTACTTCIYISRQTAKQAMLAEADLVLVSRNHPRYIRTTPSLNKKQEIVASFCQPTKADHVRRSCQLCPVRLCVVLLSGFSGVMHC